jgi:tetratricopeptide (TPR) repeat protein
MQEGDYRAAQLHHEQSLAIGRELGERRLIADSVNNLGLVLCQLGDFAGARPLFEETLAIWREEGDRLTVASALNNLPASPRSRTTFRCLRASRLFGDPARDRRPNGIATSLNNQGALATDRLLSRRAGACRGVWPSRTSCGIGWTTEALEGIAATALVRTRLCSAHGVPPHVYRGNGAPLRPPSKSI